MRLASTDEQAMRDGVIPVLRELCPGARIIHELVVGHCRADLAVIEAQRITLVEIKSKKDKLTRLDRQVRAFAKAAHQVIVLADERWFAEKHRVEMSKCSGAAEIWQWPRPSSGERFILGQWNIPHWYRGQPEPRAADLLWLLWRAELETECHRHGIAVTSRTPMLPMIRDMAWLMTGREIVEAVCRQLRARSFPDADTPMFEAESQAA